MATFSKGFDIGRGIVQAGREDEQLAQQQAQKTQLQGLLGQIGDPRTTAQDRIGIGQQLAAINPQLASEALGAQQTITGLRNEEAQFFGSKAAQGMRIQDPNVMDQFLKQSVVEASNAGFDTSEIFEVLKLPHDQRVQELSVLGGAFEASQPQTADLAERKFAFEQEKFAEQGRRLEDPPLSAEQRAFEALIKNFNPEDQEKARRQRAKIDAAPVGSAAVTIAKEGLTDLVAKSQSKIAQSKKFAEATGTSRVKLIDKGFSAIQGIDKNIRNIDKAIGAIGEGASTGAIESRFFPSIRKSTVQLEQIQNELALDIVGATTFGALSKGELDLARETALPTGLEPEDLKVFLANKRNAQEKLRGYYMEQIKFLDQGGSVAEFLEQKSIGTGGAPLSPEEQAELQQLEAELGSR